MDIRMENDKKRGRILSRLLIQIQCRELKCALKDSFDNGNGDDISNGRNISTSS